MSLGQTISDLSQDVVSYRLLSDNLIELRLATDLHLNQLVDHLNDQLPSYRFTLEDVQPTQNGTVVRLSFYPTTILPRDAVVNILLQSEPRDAVRIGSILPGYQREVESPYFWRQFVLNKYGHLYPLFEQIDPSRVDWRQLHDELERLSPKKFDSDLFVLAVMEEAEQLVRILFEDPSIDPSHQSSVALLYAVQAGRVDFVEQLLQDPRVDPTLLDNQAIIISSEQGNLPLVNLLLKDPRVDPAARNNQALICAVGYGHTEVARRLLQDERVVVDPRDRYLLASAMSREDPELVELLLETAGILPYPDVIIMAMQNKIPEIARQLIRYNRSPLTLREIIAALRLGYPELVDQIVSSGRFLRYPHDYTYLKALIMEGESDIINQLLQNNIISPNDLDLYVAASYGRLELIDLVLQLTSNNDADNALLHAAKWGRLNLVDRLLKDGRADPAFLQNEPLIQAAQHGHLEVVDRLLQDPRVDPNGSA